MAGTDLVQRTQQTVELLDHPQYLEQIEELLPENVPLKRFMQVAKTAIRATPDLVNADQGSLFGAIIRCAQDGLYPDNHEAALVPYKGKVSYLPMVTGVIRVARDYGWLMHADAVYENDEFEWLGSDQKPLHRHPRPGTDRGQLVAAYAYATQHGETMAVALYEDDISRRRKKAQTQNVWTEWPEAMWRKSAAHALYRKLPRSDRDLTHRFDENIDPAVAAAILYGPDGAAFRVTSPPAADALDAGRPPADEPSNKAADGVERGQQADGAVPAASSVPDEDDDEDEDEPLPPAAANAGELAAAAEAVAGEVVPSGGWKGMTLAQVADAGDTGVEWLGYALRHPTKYDDGFVAALETYVQGALPELWATHAEWLEQKAAA